MSEKEFLAVLTAIAVKQRLNPPQVRGYDSMAFSRAFIREGHFDGGPGFIKTMDGGNIICLACHFLTGKMHEDRKWQKASHDIGLSPRLAEEIAEACSLSLERDPKLYHRLLDACELTQSDEDEDDIKSYYS